MIRWPEIAKVGLVLFVAGVVQVSVVATMQLAGGTADLLLVAVAAIALLRGPIYGAASGFFGGLLVDTATLETLGLTSLALTIAGYWIGRYGERTTADRAHAPILPVVVVTVLYGATMYALHFLLGYDVSARLALLEALPPTILLNLLLAAPVYALCRRFVPPTGAVERAREVRLVG